MIHLIITSGSIKAHYKERKEQYIKSISGAMAFDYFFDSITVLECVSSYEDYLSAYPVYYSKESNTFPEKGLNEMLHIKAFLEQSAIDKNDLVIKLTGRYLLEDSSFFNKVKILEDRYDSIFKDDCDIYEGLGYHTFLYCMSKSRFLETINSLNFSKENLDPIEWGVKDFLKNKERHYLLDRLGVMAYQGQNSEKIFRS